MIFGTFYIILLYIIIFLFNFSKSREYPKCVSLRLAKGKECVMNQPNYLLIICDQLSAAALRAYGNTYSHTPNLDRLAAQSAVFEYTYTPCPLCQPARASFWTSRYPHETGVRTNLPKQRVPFYKGEPAPDEPETFPSVPDTITTMGEIFSQAGYNCIHFGKTHDYGGLRGFQVVPSEEIHIERTNPAINFDYETYLDLDTAAKTVDWFTKEAPGCTKPFLAVADLQNPHNICGYIGEKRDGCHPESFPLDRELPPLPENFVFDDLENRPEFIQYLCCAHRRLRHASHWTPEDYQYYLYAYYYYLSMADKQIGQILDALEQSGKAENTSVIFFADHGEGMAAHGMVTKYGVFYEESNRVPLLVSGPGIAAGKRIDGVTSLLDLLPTMMDYAGISGVSEKGFSGRSQINALTGASSVTDNLYAASEWHDEFRDYTVPGRMICDLNYKYTCYGEPDSEELFDLRTDRLEKKNLAHLPKYAPVLEEYRRKLNDHLAATNDDFLRLAVSDTGAYRHHAPGFCHHDGLSAVEIYSESIRNH